MGGHAADLHILPISGFHQKGWKHNRSFQKQNKKDTREKKHWQKSQIIKLGSILQN